MSLLIKKNFFYIFFYLLFLPQLIVSQKIQVKPKKVKASSYHSSGYTRYIHDGDKNTAWAPKGTKTRNPKSGIGDYIDFKFAKKQVFKEFKIYNGVYGYRWYRKNNRATKISLTFDGKKTIEYYLKDTQNQQIFKIPNIKSSSIRLTILDKKLGTHKKADEYTLGISDVSFYALNQLLYDIKQLPLGTPKRTYAKIIKKLSTKIYRRSKVKVNLSKYKIDGHSLLAYAIKSGNYNLTLALLENGASVHSVNISHLSIQNTNEEFADFANHVKNQRSIYQQDVNTLKSNRDFSLKELQQFSKKLSNDYYYLWKEEKEELKKLIVAKESNAHLRDLKDKVSEIINKPHNKNTLELAVKFNTRNYNRLQKIDYSERKKLNEKLKQKINQVLSDLTSERLYQISSWSSFNKLATLNNSYNRFTKEYKKYTNYTSVKNVVETYKNQKALIIKNSYNLIVSKLENTDDLDFLTVMEKVYFTNITKTNTVRNLIQLFKNKKEKLKAIKEQQNREFISELKKEFNDVNNKAIELKKKVITKRKKLQIKYGVNFPNNEDLYDILWRFKSLKDRISKTQESKFIQSIEKHGYMNTLDDIYSDINIFENKKGYKIVVYKKNGEQGLSLTINNPPKDVIGMYIEEFSSYLRPAFKSIKEPIIFNGNLKIKPKNYVKSGGTIYYYKYEDNKFKIILYDNNITDSKIVLERTNYNTYKYNSLLTYTSIFLEKGDKIELNASGYITTGLVLSTKYPPSGKGYYSGRFDDRFKYGALLGKIGNGEWFLIGNKKIIVAKNKGFLQLRMNKKRLSDNRGFFTVKYKFK